MQTRRFVLGVLIALLASSVSFAAPIYNSVSGTGAAPSGVNSSSVTISGSPGITSSLLAGLAGTNSPYTMTLGAVGAFPTNGAVTFASNFVLNVTGPAAGTVTFQYTGLGDVINSNRIDAGLKLIGNTTGLDFGTIGNALWTFSTTFNGFSVVTGNPGLFQGPGTASASWSINFSSEPQTAVPEPASALVWGSVAVAGWMVRRRRARS